MSHQNRGEILRRCAEAIVLGMACLAPWAFGSVEARAQIWLFGGTAAVTILVTIADRASSRALRLFCVPSLALAGLVILALFQVVPIPESLFRWISPGSAELRAELLPIHPERVLGDSGPTDSLPSPRLSQDPDSTVQMAVQLAATWLLFQGVLGLGGRGDVLRRLAIVCSLNATLLALFSIVQALTWNGRIYWVRPSPTSDAWSSGGPFVSHTHLAESLNMGLGLALGLVVPGGWRDLLRGKTYRIWAVYAAVVIVAGIVASNSRGGFLAMLASGACLALLLRRHVIRIGIGAISILGLVGIILAAMGDSSPFLQRIVTIIDPNDSGYSIRMEIWRAAARAWWNYPLWGSGLGTFPEATVRYLVRDRGSFFSRAENEYLDLLSEGGIAGIALILIGGSGVVRLARRALLATANPLDRGLILGAVFGLVSLSFNSLSDFGPHIPGVSILAVILVATLCRLGLVEGTSPDVPLVGTRIPARVGWTLYGVGATMLGLILISQGWTNVRIENLMVRANLPMPGESTPALGDFSRIGSEQERQREALEAALRLRPGWTDGHLRLGMLHLVMYERMAADWLRDSGKDNAVRAADPLWLFGVVHDADRRESSPISKASLLEHDPVRLHLVPATRSFLQARRSCPVSAIAHVELASLDYLLEEGDSVPDYLNRVLKLAGNGAGTLTFGAEVAIRSGDSKLASRFWRRSLEASPGGWAEIADVTSMVLTPDQILEDVVPNGQIALRFADRLYSEPEAQPNRQRFLRTAARLIPEDVDLLPADRLYLEALAWAGLDESGPARERMEAALALVPQRDAWRKELIEWLLRWEEFDEAHSQARLWLYFSPDSKPARLALDLTADALARHSTKP